MKVKVMANNLDLFESYARKRKQFGSPLIEDTRLSKAENAIIRRVNAETTEISHEESPPY